MQKLTLSWKMCAKMSSILIHSPNVMLVLVHIQSIKVLSSNKNGTAMNLLIQIISRCLLPPGKLVYLPLE